ncbi:unnamed protein product [Rotaria sp. Silwood1]|nr:unnamed protein product [Rotaria sp. Silwood1]
MMNNRSFQFEFLPNEILIILFEYFDIRDLYRSFFNINTRLNNLLLSLKHLSLTISNSNQTLNEYDKILISYINKLIIQNKIDIDFTCFTHIHSLILVHPTFEQIKQLNKNILTCLKYLAIRNMYLLSSNDLPAIFDKIFSNDLSHLQYCYLSNMTTIRRTREWIQMTSLRFLEVGHINLFDYKYILSLCPNLYSFKFIISTETEIPSDIKSHLNIKRLTLKNDFFAHSWNDHVIKSYLSCVPNLEQLCMYRHIFSSTVKNCLLNYDWCASLISSYLPSLHRFSFYLHLIELNYVDIDNILFQLVENFRSHRNTKCQSCFVIQY